MGAGLNRPSGHLDVSTALDPYTGAWNDRLAAHLLRRAGFGGTTDEIAHVTQMSIHDAVESLVLFPTSTNAPQPSVYDPAADMAPYVGLGRRAQTGDPQADAARRQLFMQIRHNEQQSILGLQNWWLDRMLTTTAPLQEKMTLYFHGHFTSAAIQKGVTPSMTFGQNQLFRNNALGNLRDLTTKVSTDPAMLLYLDGAQSTAAHPNENYARELMELFTLGVDNYTEDDVRQSARAWTGWTVNRLDGSVNFVPRRHDGASKTFLGQTGNFAGQDIVNVIFSQPQASKFFAQSLLGFFVYNDPEPELIDAFAAVIRKYDFNLQPVMSTLFHSNVFFSDRAYRALVKSPVEFVVGTYKTFGFTTIDIPAQRVLTAMGQTLFYPPNVAGWPGGENWLTSQTMITRQNFIASLANSPMMTKCEWLQSVSTDAPSAAKALVSTILHGDASPAAVSQITDFLNGAGTSAMGTLSGENYEERIRGAAYLTMATPAYQLG